MILREATMRDARVLYEWRTDELTSTVSHNPQAFDFASHTEWLERSLRSSRRRILIAEIDGVPVGTVRIDDADELSWTVAPKWRQRGIGKQMLKALIHLYNGPFRAEIKSNNVASRKVAESAGMHIVAERSGICYYSSARGGTHS